MVGKEPDKQMDVLDSALRRGTQVAAYQRDDLFNRRPNLIPTSLKMIVEPKASERTMALLRALNDDVFEMTEVDQGGGPSGVAVTRAMAELAVAANRISAMRMKYLHLYDKSVSRVSVSEPSGVIDEVMDSCNINTDTMGKVTAFYKDLTQLKAISSSKGRNQIQQTERVDTKIAECSGRDIRREIEALKHVRWS